MSDFKPNPMLAAMERRNNTNITQQDLIDYASMVPSPYQQDTFNLWEAQDSDLRRHNLRNLNDPNPIMPLNYPNYEQFQANMYEGFGPSISEETRYKAKPTIPITNRNIKPTKPATKRSSKSITPKPNYGPNYNPELVMANNLVNGQGVTMYPATAPSVIPAIPISPSSQAVPIDPMAAIAADKAKARTLISNGDLAAYWNAQKAIQNKIDSPNSGLTAQQYWELMG